MKNLTLLDNVELVKISNAVAAGTSTVNSDSVDTSDCEGVVLITQMGAINASAATSFKAQQSDDDGNSDAFADLEGTSITIADDEDNTLFALDIHNPREQYIRGVISRATADSEVSSMIAVKYGQRKLPITQGATVSGSETHDSPAEGTA